jgi:2-keto-3-deoxy-L-rhamnonate aldolase RhmA
MGLRGKQDDPELQKMMERVLAAAKKHGKYAGRPAFTAASIPKLLEQGFQFFQTPSETKMMSEGARAYLEPFGKSGSGTKANY